jgi:hypothetical protein
MSIITVDYGSITGGGAVTFDGLDNSVNCYNAPVEYECTNCLCFVGSAFTALDQIGCYALEDGVEIKNVVYNSGVTFTYSSGKLTITKNAQIGSGSNYYYVKIMYS